MYITKKSTGERLIAMLEFPECAVDSCHGENHGIAEGRAEGPTEAAAGGMTSRGKCNKVTNKVQVHATSTRAFVIEQGSNVKSEDAD